MRGSAACNFKIVKPPAKSRAKIPEHFVLSLRWLRDGALGSRLKFHAAARGLQRMFVMKRSLALALGSVLALSFAAPAFADPQEPRRQTVSQDGLDTYSDDGADILIRRLRNAAENVCGDRAGPEPVVQEHVTRVCTYETTANAVADANNSVVTARYYGYEPEVIVDDYGSVKGK